tara:strand:- start:437 stop:694 length:258 start_codon:yes stop_codon:yes gene_type:complete
MKTLYRYELTGEDLWWGKGIANPEYTVPLGRRYFLLNDDRELSEVENITIKINEAEYPDEESNPEFYRELEASKGPVGFNETQPA